MTKKKQARVNGGNGSESSRSYLSQSDVPAFRSKKHSVYQLLLLRTTAAEQSRRYNLQMQ